MNPWIHLDTAQIPGGGELKLMQRGQDFSIMSGTIELMNSRLSGSEIALANLAWDKIKDRKAPRMLIGGALGNVVDRIAYGAVADFLNMSCCGFENPYAFNVADIAIFSGAIGLVLFSKEDGAKPRKSSKPRRKTP